MSNCPTDRYYEEPGNPRPTHVPYAVLEMEVASGAITSCTICPNKGMAVGLAVALITRPDHPAEMRRPEEPVTTPAGPRPTLRSHRLNLWQYDTTECDGYRYSLAPAVLHPAFTRAAGKMAPFDCLRATEDEMDARENRERQAAQGNRVEPSAGLLFFSVVVLALMAAVVSGALQRWLGWAQ